MWSMLLSHHSLLARHPGESRDPFKAEAAGTEYLFTVHYSLAEGGEMHAHYVTRQLKLSPDGRNTVVDWQSALRATAIWTLIGTL